MVRVPDQRERQGRIEGQHTRQTAGTRLNLRRVIVGDSIVRHLRPPLGASVIPAGGATSSSLWTRVREEVRKLGHIHGLVIMVGTNDVGRGTSLRDFEAQYGRMVREFQDLRPDVIWLINILPRPVDDIPVRRHNSVISEIADRRGCVYVNVHKSFTDQLGRPKLRFFRRDGLHLNQAGSDRLFDIMASTINDRLLAMRLH